MREMSLDELLLARDLPSIVVLDDDVAPADLAGVPAVVVGVDVERDVDLDRLEAAVAANPLAAVTLATVMRGTLDRSVADGLVAESSAYSLLQAGPEHGHWLQDRRSPRPRAPEPSPVRVRRRGDVLELRLDRPAVRNAFSAAMRDALLEGLAVAVADPDVQVAIDGAGPAFCSGGDLDEFGTTPDPATAHVIRLQRSVGRTLAAISGRVTVRVHGACVGAGVELPAFAGRVVAAADATFRLPEVAMGLIPGAGGTVSIPRRIGAQRTAWLALSGESIDAATALRWGLVDEIDEVSGEGPGG